MKKIFAIIVAMLLVLSIGLSASAAVTMSPYVFRGTEADGNTYIYHFGTRSDVNEEVGIKINGENYKAENFDSSTNTKFGIGIADPSNKLGDSYTVIPYAGETEYAPVSVNKNAKENVVINTKDSKEYVAEPAFSVKSCYTARLPYDEFTASFTEYANNNSNYSMNAVYNVATGNDYGYSVPFIQFDMPEGLTNIADGRKLYLDVTTFGSTEIEEDFYLDLYGVKEEGTYSLENLPEADITNGIIDSALMPVEKFTTGTASDRVRVRFDVTNYVKKRIYENSDTITFAFKQSGIVYNGAGDHLNTVIYTGYKTAVDTSIAFDPISEIIFAPAITYGGEFDTKVPANGYTKAQIKVTDYAARQQSIKQYRTPSVANTVQLISAYTNSDFSVQTGYMQLTMPESFEGVEKGTKIELVFNSYIKTTTNNLPARIYALGTVNEYDASKRPTVDKTVWSEDYPLRDRNTVLGSFDIPVTATSSAPLTCTLDITEYVLSKMASGEDTATISFKVEYQDKSTASGLLWAQIYAHDTATAYAPYVQYRQGEDTFLTDGSDINWNLNIQASAAARREGVWATSDNKRIGAVPLNETTNTLYYRTGGSASNGSAYNSCFNTSFDNWIICSYNLSFNIADIITPAKLLGDLPEGKKVYLNLTYDYEWGANQGNNHTLTVVSLSGGTKNITLTPYEGASKTGLEYTVYNNAVKVAESAPVPADKTNIKIDITDAVKGFINSSTNQIVLAVHPTLEGGTAEYKTSSQSRGQLYASEVMPYITVE